MVSRRQALIGAMVIVVLTSLLNYTLVYAGHGLWARFRPPLPAELAHPAFREFLSVLKHVEQNYVTPLDRGTLFTGATRGMLKALDDPYSYYMDAREYQELQIQTEGVFGGIGVTVEYLDNYVTVISVLEGTPAEQAGLQAGDRVSLVDGRDVTPLPYDQILSMIRGKPGSTVTITVLRGTQKVDFSIVRAEIHVKSVSWKKLAGDLAYVRISRFQAETGEQFLAALNEIKAAKLTGIIIDLRNNGGGLLTQCVAITEALIPSGPVVLVEDREGNRRSLGKGHAKDLPPLVILVNEFTASASEILAGAVKDTGTGTLVGVKTFGKGTVQSLLQLAEGAAVKLTTQRFLTPTGYSIHDNGGIQPDVVVALTDADRAQKLKFDDPRHPQLARAIELLRGR